MVVVLVLVLVLVVAVVELVLCAFQPYAAGRFKVDSGFKGADGAGSSSSGGKPVQFEREKESDKEDVSVCP